MLKYVKFNNRLKFVREDYVLQLGEEFHSTNFGYSRFMRCVNKYTKDYIDIQICCATGHERRHILKAADALSLRDEYSSKYGNKIDYHYYFLCCKDDFGQLILEENNMFMGFDEFDNPIRVNGCTLDYVYLESKISIKAKIENIKERIKYYVQRIKRKLYSRRFDLAIQIIALNVFRYGQKLTPDYLLKNGWIEKDGFYIETGVEPENTISVSFNKNHSRVCNYTVWHGIPRVRITTENSTQWLKVYCCLVHSSTLYNLAWEK